MALTLTAERFTLERQPGVARPLLAVKCIGWTQPNRYIIDDPEQLFVEILNVLGPWLAQPGTLPEVSAGGELFDQAVMQVMKEER